MTTHFHSFSSRCAIALMVWATAFTPVEGEAQSAGSMFRCGAANCEEASIVVTAIDAALKASDFCAARPARVLASLYPAPYTEFGDGVRGRTERFGVPSSPSTLRLEDIGILKDGALGQSLTIVDTTRVLRDAGSVEGCLLVASPPSFRGADLARVIVAVSDAKNGRFIQRFVFLQRQGDSWIVVRQEIGYRS